MAELRTKEVDLPLLHEGGQWDVADSPARFKAVATGRRWGKSLLGSELCYKVAANGGRAWWIAPTYKMAGAGWDQYIRLWGSDLKRIGAKVRLVDRAVRLPGGGEVAVRSADDPDSLRGFALDFVVLDECAFMKEVAWTEAIRPSLGDRLGGAIFFSTPKGRNWFWRLWQRAKDEDNWASWRFESGDNPYLLQSEIEEARSLLPIDIFKQEYLAEFLENEGAVFRNIRPCLNAPLDAKPEDHEGHTLVAGADWGKQNDFTVISIGCKTCKTEVALDRYNKIDYAFQRKRITELLNKWHNPRLLPERNAMGEPVIEQLIRDGVKILLGPDDKHGFQTTASSKPPLIEDLALTFEREEWQWLNIRIATLELEAYERKLNPITARSTYGAPAGLHDDTVMARALMRRAARRSRSGIHI